MASQWSSTDPLRRAVFIGLVAVVMLPVGYVAAQAIGARRSIDASTPPRTAPTVPLRNSAVADRTVNPPPGHQQDDREPVGPVGPVSVAPRPPGVPPMPLSTDQLTAAYDHAMSFVEVFANARSDEPVDARIAKVKPFVAPASLDLVLTQYQRVRPRSETQETSRYRVTGSRWVIVAENQATLLVDGIRTVEAGGRSDDAPLAFAITLSRTSGAWLVTTARDPREGDSGGR